MRMGGVVSGARLWEVPVPVLSLNSCVASCRIFTSLSLKERSADHLGLQGGFHH